MFKFFGSGNSVCPRCGQVGTQASERYCRACGISHGAPHPVLRDNRWQPRENEVALFFGVAQLSGLFRKALIVPPAARAYILQGDKATEVPQGEYELEGFFTRLNHLLRDLPGEVLIARQAPFTLAFSLHGIASADYLLLDIACTVPVQIETISAFAGYFMQMPGVVTTEQLHRLMEPLLRQVLVEFFAAQSLPDLARNPLLREQLNERMHSALKLRLAHFGLGLGPVETLSLQHDKWDQNRQRQASLALILDARRVELDYEQQLARLYSEQEWAKIAEQEQTQRSQLRRAQLAREQREQRANLILDEREQLQALRAREIELYGRIVEATTRKHAIARGAQAEIAQIELDLARQSSERQGEAEQWQQVRELAQIKLRTELELAQIVAKQQILHAQQQIDTQIADWQRQQQLANIEQIGDLQARRNEQARWQAQEAQAQRAKQRMADEQLQADLQLLQIERAARAREAERMQEWQDDLAQAKRRELIRGDDLKDAEHQREKQLVLQKIADLQRQGGQADAVAQQQKLLQTIDAQSAFNEAQRRDRRAQEQDAIDAEQQRALLQQQQQEAAWQHQLAQQEQEHRQRLARFAALDQVSDLSKVALADLPNATLVADILKMQVQAGMSAGQIAASYGAGEARATSTASSAGDAGQASATSDAGAANVVNAASSAGIASSVGSANSAGAAGSTSTASSASGGSVAPAASTTTTTTTTVTTATTTRTCKNGHVNSLGAKFCTECGIALE